MTNGGEKKVNTKYWFAIITMIFLVSIASTTFAAITVTDLNVSCDPVTPSNGACYYASKMTLDYKVTDSNKLPPNGDTTSLADGNQTNWRITISYGPNGNCKASGLATTITDTNARKICDADVYGIDTNFVKGRNCHSKISFPNTISNGSFCADVNVATYTTSAVDGKFNADKNGSVTFTINNALATNQTISLLNMLPILLAGLAMVIGLILVLQGANVPGLIAFIVGVIAVIVYTLIQVGIMPVLTG